MTALRRGQRGHVGLHQCLHHLQRGAHGQREQALLHVLGDLGHRHADPFRDRGHGRVRGLVLATLLHGGPLAVGVSWRTLDTYHTAGLERGTATSNFHDARDKLPAACAKLSAVANAITGRLRGHL